MQDFDLAVSCLAQRGRMIVMAGREARPPFPVGPFYVKDCSLFGFAMFNAPPDEQRQAAEEINRWLADGQAASADRSRAAAVGSGRRPSAARRQHARRPRHPGRQDRAGTVTTEKQSECR